MRFEKTSPDKNQLEKLYPRSHSNQQNQANEELKIPWRETSKLQHTHVNPASEVMHSLCFSLWGPSKLFQYSNPNSATHSTLIEAHFFLEGGTRHFCMKVILVQHDCKQNIPAENTAQCFQNTEILQLKWTTYIPYSEPTKVLIIGPCAGQRYSFHRDCTNASQKTIH